jgi:hypothetical protein
MSAKKSKMEWVPLREHLKELMRANDRRYMENFKAVAKALKVAARETRAKNTELNDVRHRFIPREVFEAYKAEQVKRGRATLVTFVVMGLTIIGLILQILRH